MPSLRWIPALLATLAPVLRAQTSVARAPVPGAPAEVTAFIDVNVVPMDAERVFTKHTVLIKDGWITALGPSKQLAVPAGATRIEGRGQYLIPGLSDCHAHLSQHLNDSAKAAVEAERRLALYLAHGVTTIRNADFGDAKQQDWTLALLLRARTAAGTLWGPRIYTSGYWPGRGRDTRKVPPESLTAVLTAYKAAGFDFVKLHDQSGWNQVEDTVLTAAVVTAARRVGLPVVGHVAVGSIDGKGGMPMERAIALGYTSIEHLMGYTGTVRVPRGEPSLAQVRATQRAGVWNCPTLAVVATSPGIFRDVPAYARLVKALHKAGAGVLLGTDAVPPRVPYSRVGFIGEPGVATALELHALVAAGLTPYQALRTGTWNAAQYFGTLDESGTVAVGKRADLVLLSGNPLERVLHTSRPAGVMIGGRWLSRTAIDEQLTGLTPGSQADKEYYTSLVDTAAAAIAEELQGLPSGSLTVAQRMALRQLARGIRDAPFFYWEDFIESFSDGIRSMMLPVAKERSTEQQQQFSALWLRHYARQKALADSLRSSARDDTGTHRRVRSLVTQQLGEYRPLLTPEQLAGFDRRAGVWVREQTRQGFPVTISGIKATP